MAVLEDLTEDERYLLALLEDESGVDQAEFLWADDTRDDGVFRCYDYQVAWYRSDDKFQIDQCARAVGKSVGIQLRAFAFAFNFPGEEMLITAPELIHLDPVTRYIEDRMLAVRLSRDMLKSDGKSNGIRHRPFEVKFTNGSKIIGRIPQKDGKGIKGMHPKKLEMDEAQDYPEQGWIELTETLKYGSAGASWRAHGVTRGVRDYFYKLTQPGSGWAVHRITAMHRPDWTPEERNQKAEVYGGRHSPDYRRNILGQHGDAQNPLFVLTRLMACVDTNQGSTYNTNEYTHLRVSHERVAEHGGDIGLLMDFPMGHQAYERTWVGMDVGMCADEATEIFTKRGWLTLDEVRPGDETLSIDGADGCSYWTPVDSVHIFDDNGEGGDEWDMVALRGQSFDALVTPRHRWLVRDRKGGLRFKTTMELNSKDQVPLSVPRGDAPFAPTYKDDFVELVAWHFTEGTVNNKGSVSICQSVTENHANIERVEGVLVRLYGGPGDVKRGPRGSGGPLWSRKDRSGARTGYLREDDEMAYFYLSASISDELHAVMGDDRAPTYEFLSSLTREQLGVFVEVCNLGDGWTQQGRKLFQQGSEVRARAYEFACSLMGMAVATHRYERGGSNVSDRAHSYWHTGELRRRWVAPVGAAMQASNGNGSATVTKQRYRGRVWCPHLSRGNWLARRNGSIYFTGNTNHPTEILIFGEVARKNTGKAFKKDGVDDPDIRLKCLSRVHLERISAPDQREVLRHIFEHYRPHAMAMDKTGLGLPVYQEIINGRHKAMAKAMRGYNFSEKIVVGYEPMPDNIMDKEIDDYAIMANVLEYSSDQLRLLVDRGQLLLPWDVELLREFQGQTYVVKRSTTNPYGKKQFNQGKFHSLDAARMAALAFSQEIIEATRPRVEDFEPVLDSFVM